MPETINPKLLSWASDIDEDTVRQAEKTARLPIVEGHVALMPDAHVGIGATVGSVIPTKGAIIPSAVGVDIGCGMIAAELDVTASPAARQPRAASAADRAGRPRRCRAGPHGKRGPRRSRPAGGRCLVATHRPATVLTAEQAKKALRQFGSLGSGNHFVEVCLDERTRVWVVLHSGLPGDRQPAGPGAHRQGEAPGQGGHAPPGGPRPGLVRPGHPGVRRLRGRHAVGPGLRPCRTVTR